MYLAAEARDLLQDSVDLVWASNSYCPNTLFPETNGDVIHSWVTSDSHHGASMGRELFKFCQRGCQKWPAEVKGLGSWTTSS